MPLLSRKTIPPGGWFYEQLDASGKSFKKFHSHGPFIDFCKDVLNVRQGNGLVGAELSTVSDDVDAYQCQRLGNDPRYCVGGAVQAPLVNASTFYGSAAPGGCGGCGGQRA